jgi:HlyD family secretion protein
VNRNRWIVALVVLVVAVLGLWWWKAKSAGSAPKYRTAEADRGSIESVVSATGTVRPVVQVEIGSQVSGTVDKLNADYNSRVKAGQILVELEKSSFVAREVQAEAAVTRAEASVKDAERALRRTQELFNQTYVSEADLDAATVALDLRRADLKQAQAQLTSAQVDLAHATIRSPIDGVVISRTIDRGQTVAASLQAPQLFVIANDLSQMQVESRIDEADIGRLVPGLQVSFTVDAFPDRTFTGRVEQVRLEPITDSGVGTYTTVIQTANPDLMLRPGMTANVTIQIERREDVMRIPNAALRFRPPMPPGSRGPGAGAARGAVASDAGGRGEAGAATRNGGGGKQGGGKEAGGQQGQHAGAGGGAPAGAGNGADPGPSSGMGGRRGPRGGAIAGADSAAGTRGGWRGRHGGGGGAGDGAGAGMGAMADASAGARAAVYVLRAGKPEKVIVMTGITDGSFTEVRGGGLQPGDQIIVGGDASASSRSTNLQPPPGMGGFRGPGGGGGRGR